MKRTLARARRLVALAFYAFPADFRARHRADALSYFESRARDAGALGGRRAVAALTAREVVSTIRGGLAERWSGLRTGVPSLGSLVVDARFGLRALSRRPGFVAAAVIPLALGIGGVSSVFAVVDGVLFRPLPYPHPERLVKVGRPVQSGALLPLSTANLLDLEGSQSEFEYIGGLMGGQTVTMGSEEPELLSVARPSREFMAVFGLTPVLGRAFLDAEYHDPQVAIVSWGLWMRRWGGDPGALGSVLETELGSLEIIGVLPSDWTGPDGLRADVDLWVPLDYDNPMLERTRAFGFMAAAGRLREGGSLDAANAQLAAAAHSLAEAHPDANHENDGSPRMIEARGLHAEIVGNARIRLAIMLTSVVALLAIACANVANLFLAHGTERQHEMALRTVMGAGRIRLVVQLVTESVAVALIAGAVGIGLAQLTTGTLVAMAPDLPRAASIALDGRIVWLSIGVAAACGVAFGLAPAFIVSGRAPGDTLRGGHSRSRHADRIRGALVIGQTTLAVALVTGGGLLLNSVVRLALVEPGFETDDVVVFRPRLRQADYLSDGTSPVPFYQQLSDRLAADPDVSSVGLSMFTPGEGLPVISEARRTEGDEPTRVYRHSVMGDFFGALDIPILDGRVFDGTAGPDDARSAVVSQSFASEMWPGESAVGRTFHAQESQIKTVFTVVGVVADIRDGGPQAAVRPVFYESFLENPWLPSMAMLLRHRPDATGVPETIRAALRQVDAAIPVTEMSNLSDRFTEHTSEQRYFALLLGLFSVVALGIAAVGLYATMTYTVVRRLPEMGVRRAVGAGSAAIVALVVRRGILQAASGVVLGLGVAAFSSRLLTTLLFEIAPLDPSTYLAVAAVLLAVAFVACLMPAHRAARVDPLSILRGE